MLEQNTRPGFHRRRASSANLSALAVGLLCCAAPAFSHHGTSQYSMTEEISLTGTVTEWSFGPPHTWLRIEVAGPEGQVTEWSIESAPPGYMARQGWSAASLEPGDEVTILISPLRGDSEPTRGILLEVDPADGAALIVRPPGRFGRPAERR